MSNDGSQKVTLSFSRRDLYAYRGWLFENHPEMSLEDLIYELLDERCFSDEGPLPGLNVDAQEVVPQSFDISARSVQQMSMPVRTEILTKTNTEDVPAARRPTISSMAATALESPECVIVDGPIEMDRDQPLLGLHNRDWPSLWALSRLAAHTTTGPVSYNRFVQGLGAESWDITRDLHTIQKDVERTVGRVREGRKLTALFPSPKYLTADSEVLLKKRSASEGNFLNFALGRVVCRFGQADGAGPLPAWGAIGTQGMDGTEPLIGLTRSGKALLDAMAGLEVRYPHPPEYTRSFMAHLREHAAGDYRWFMTSLRLLADQPRRKEYDDGFMQSGLGEGLDSWAWRDSEGVLIQGFERVDKKKKPIPAEDGEAMPSPKCSSIGAGYIARGREWGLVEYLLRNGQYGLTGLGMELVK